MPDMKKGSGSTESIWMATTEIPEFDPINKDLQCDVCIIGAGITGLLTAYLLVRSGKNVIIVDDGRIGMGESSRTTAHITNVIDDRYHEIERIHGEEAMKLAAESQTAAIDLLESIIKENNISCDFSRLTGYLLFSPDDSSDELDKEYNACIRAGIDVNILPGAPQTIEKLSRYPCLQFPNQAEFHMLKFLSGLANAIIALGGKIYTGTQVKSIKDGSPAIAETSNGYNITASDIVTATNSPVSDYVAIHIKQTANRTYVTAYEIPKGSVPHALYWDNEEPYHYVRLYREDDRDILIAGGEDHKTGQEEDPEERFAKLEEWTTEHFPMVKRLVYRWSGQVMEPFDGLSFTGKDPENEEHIYIATGDSGMGVTHAAYSAMILNDLINGRQNKWAELYDPKRIKIKTAPTFIKEGINTAVQYIDVITPPKAASIDEIPIDSGAIMNFGTNKSAVYKDTTGNVYKFSAFCPHLKCIVQWNDAEKTWDCPCHGSRFAATGQVLNGPALTGLKPAEE